MALHQEFGDRPFIPTGISGDIALGHESGSEESRRALLAQRALFDELLDRQAQGLTSFEEVMEIAERFLSDIAQGYN